MRCSVLEHCSLRHACFTPIIRQTQGSIFITYLRSRPSLPRPTHAITTNDAPTPSPLPQRFDCCHSCHLVGTLPGYGRRRGGACRSIFPVLRPSRVDLPCDPKVIELQEGLGELKLSNKAIEEREITRIAATKALLEDEQRKGLREAGYILRSQTPWFVMVPYRILCWFLGEKRGAGNYRQDGRTA